MIFVIGKLKYDTDKMELISDKCMCTYPSETFGARLLFYGKDVKIWRSKNGRWLLTYISGHDTCCAAVISEEEAQSFLLKYDVAAYEKAFGELEEA